ncbi:MAG: hypothetical protein IKJ65_09405 [Clostridia bacterium]|nr:hypothetical protein [Clostridia bacterium]
MKKIVIIALFLLTLLFCACASAEPEWVFPENDEDLRFYVIAASSDDKNMLVYTMKGQYPACESDMYLLNPSSGVCTRLNFTKHANEEAVISDIWFRYYREFEGKTEDEILSILFEREGISDPYAYLISRGHSDCAQLDDVRDDFALVTLPGYASKIIVNLKTGEAYIPQFANELGMDGTYISWSYDMVYHYGPGDELLKTYLPELPEGASISLAHLNDDASLAICAASMGNKTFNHTFVLTDSKGNAEKTYPLGSSRRSFSTILALSGANTYVVFDDTSINVCPAYFINAESDEVNMLKMDSVILLDKNKYVYSAEMTAYDSETESDVWLLPLRFNQQNELIAFVISEDSDLVKINLDTNEAKVLLSGVQWRNLKDAKFPDQFSGFQKLHMIRLAHNGSRILSVYPGGAIRLEP